MGKAMTAEERLRRSNFLVIVGMGREKQGKLLDALRLYIELAAMDPDELVPLVSDPDLKVRREVCVHGRVEQMLKTATPQQRKQLEDEMLKRWKKQKSEHETATDGNFVAFRPDKPEPQVRSPVLRLQAAEDYLHEKDWPSACKCLQVLLTLA